MRADRLVAILMLLQTRGQVTAAEVADELEISERTARRDLDALGQAGLPIYSTQGRNGGWRLLGSGRTDLSGLTAAEARALFLMAGPSAGATPELKAALRKLVRALPEPFRPGAEAAATSVVIDRTGWDRRPFPNDRPPPTHLNAVQEAVVEGGQVRLGYVDRTGAATERVVEPLGLAAKGSTWYMVGDTPAGLRTFRVDRVTSVELTGQPATRPEGFDLDAAWQMISERVGEMRSPVRAVAAADRDVLPLCRWLLGTRLAIGPPREDGRVDVELRGMSVPSLAGEIAGLGGRVEVFEPVEVRDQLALVGRELAALYPGGGQLAK
ncbi:MAG TPA: YafY family protein [Acidimicrobiales bacterium]|nr:YafY family protein [Acidimicrobiales bacterium]